MKDKKELRLVICNCPVEDAKNLATLLVEEKYAACVNVVEGVKSVYRWEGKVLQEVESTLLIKTTLEFSVLQEKLLAEHRYDVPEIIEVAVSDAFAGYVDYVRECTTPE